MKVIPALDGTKKGSAIADVTAVGGLAITVTDAGVDAPHPLVAVKLYVVVDCGWGISTNPEEETLPIPLILTVRPVADVSVTDQESLTV